jgi:MoxR-like ATPase
MTTENTQILEYKEKLDAIKAEMHQTIIGQESLIESLLVWVMTNGHILLEWVPWIAKTLTIDTLSKTLGLDFKRIQFTPDLLPSDLIGTEIYNMGTQDFHTKKGPLFTNFVLADEINRAPSKVQSALLEAMAEKQITIWDTTYKLPEPFLVLATQNPIEQSGTYKLPEAELDRFLLKSTVSYPDKAEERKILENIQTRKDYKTKKIISKKEVLEIQTLTQKIHISTNIYDYITDLVFATRSPEKYELEGIQKYLSYGVSPRWGIALIQASQAIAFQNGRDFVIPEDVKQIAHEALAHRLVLNYEAIADEVTADDIVTQILEKVKIH